MDLLLFQEKKILSLLKWFVHIFLDAVRLVPARTILRKSTGTETTGQTQELLEILLVDFET